MTAYQLAHAEGAATVISTAGSRAKAAGALQLGFTNVIDLSTESLALGGVLIRVPVAGVYPMSEIKAAVTHLLGGGKILIDFGNNVR